MTTLDEPRHWRDDMTNKASGGNDGGARRGRGSDKDGARAGKPKKRGADVIHVVFGAGGGRIPPGALGPHPDGANGSPPSGAAANGATPSGAPAPASGEPVTDLFTVSDVAKLLGVTRARLRTLD